MFWTVLVATTTLCKHFGAGSIGANIVAVSFWSFGPALGVRPSVCFYWAVNNDEIALTAVLISFI